MPPNVPVNLITGFLGAGKTTLVRHVLEHGLAGRKVAVIVNEIGEIGIDGRLIEGLENIEEMVELTSGCICCSPGLQFGLAVQEILDTVKPELLVIETTGTAQVAPLLTEIEALGLRVDAVTCVVDAENAAYHLQKTVAARDQVCHADFLVVNKCDLVAEATLRKLEKRLSRLNKRAVRRRTRFGEIDYDLLFATSGKTYRDRATGITPGNDHLGEDGIESFVFESTHPFGDLQRLQRVLGQLHRDIYRIKGLACVGEDCRNVLVNVTCGRVCVDPAPPALARFARTSLVVIGRQAVSDYRQSIEQRLHKLTIGSETNGFASRRLGNLFTRI